MASLVGIYYTGCSRFPHVSHVDKKQTAFKLKNVGDVRMLHFKYARLNSLASEILNFRHNRDPVLIVNHNSVIIYI